MKRVVLPIAILLVSLLITGVLLRTPATVMESAPEMIPVSVRVTEVQQQSVQLVVVLLLGFLLPCRRVLMWQKEKFCCG